MIVAIHQPAYLPWIGFLHKLCNCDLFVILDNVQYEKGGFVNRNRVKNQAGWQWLTVPIIRSGSDMSINEMKVNNANPWWKKHWATLKSNYGRAPYFREYASVFESIYDKKWEYLSELDIFIIRQIMGILQTNKQLKIASELGVSGHSTQLLLNICKAVGADTYLSGISGRNYLDLNIFSEAGITVVFQQFKHPVYPQCFEDAGFQSNMSVVDLLFNCGLASLEIIRNSS